MHLQLMQIHLQIASYDFTGNACSYDSKVLFFSSILSFVSLRFFISLMHKLQSLNTVLNKLLPASSIKNLKIFYFTLLIPCLCSSFLYITSFFLLHFWSLILLLSEECFFHTQGFCLIFWWAAYIFLSPFPYETSVTIFHNKLLKEKSGMK
jgi:hypothetical protein